MTGNVSSPGASCEARSPVVLAIRGEGHLQHSVWSPRLCQALQGLMGKPQPFSDAGQGQLPPTCSERGPSHWWSLFSVPETSQGKARGLESHHPAPVLVTGYEELIPRKNQHKQNQSTDNKFSLIYRNKMHLTVPSMQSSGVKHLLKANKLPGQKDQVLPQLSYLNSRFI